MRLFSNVFIAAVLACLLASVAFIPEVSGDDVALQSIVVTDSAGLRSEFDVYPGEIGVNGAEAPVYVVADKAGDIEMLCIMNSGESVGMRKEEGRQPGYSKPDLMAVAMQHWRDQHRGGG